MNWISIEIRTQYRDWGANWEQVIKLLNLDTRRTKTGRYVCQCIFHEDRNPSLWLYPNGSYICYACNERGSIPDFLFSYYHYPDLEELLVKLVRQPTPGQLSLEIDP